MKNLHERRVSGSVFFRNRYLTEQMRPEDLERSFRLGRGEAGSVFFPIPEDLASPNFNERVEAEVRLAGADSQVIGVKDRLHFRATPYAERPITVDGDLGDWPLDTLDPVTFTRIRRVNVDEPAPDDMESKGRFYSVWRDDTLYMALEVEDTTPQSRFMDINMWMDDNILLGIYPWRYREGERFNSGFYREHIGLHKDGSIGTYRSHYVPGGTGDMSAVQVAITYHEEGRYVYEIAYPKEALYPLHVEPGGGFRLSLTYFDAMDFMDAKYFHGQLYFFGGANVNYHTDVGLWYDFIFTE